MSFYQTRNLLLLLFTLISSVSFSQKLIGEIKINADEKNITNLSGKFNDSISYNIIINKKTNSEHHESILYFYSKNNFIKSSPLLVTKNKPNFLTYHINEDILTLTREVNNKVLVYDYDYKTDKVISSEIQINPKGIFSHENVIFITNKLSETNVLKMIKVKSSTDITKTVVYPKTSLEKELLRSFTGENFEFINDLQFIEKGSIKKYKGYYDGTDLILTKDDDNSGKVSFFRINTEGNIDSKVFNIPDGKSSKKLKSFYKDEKLFVFNMHKSDAFLSIYDTQSSKTLKSINYNTEDFGPHNKVVINGKETTDNFKNKKRFYKSFFPQAIGSVYNAELYIGVNKSINDDYIVQIGHVDKNKFQNNTANNYWWGYSAFSTNYSVSSGSFSASFSASFNPAAFSLIFFQALADEKSKGNFFEIDLDKGSLNLKDKQKPKLHAVDNKKYNDRLSNIMKLKNNFYISMSDYVRFINFDKKNNTYHLYNLSKY